MKYNWTFTIKDLEEIDKYYNKKKEEVEKFREYSKPQRKILSTYEKIKKIIESINLLKKKTYINKLIDFLNGKEKPDSFQKLKRNYFLGRILYSANKYFLKVRVSLNYLKFKNKKIDKLCFLPIIIQKLIANKIVENGIAEKPNRNKAIEELIKFLRRELENLEEFQIIRADFRSYALNIRRKKIFEILKRRNIPENIINLIKKFIEDSTIEARIFKSYDFEKFFKKIEYKDDYEFDGDFKSIIGYEGILPGTPLANILGQLYLEEFDEEMKGLAGNKGFYIRYFDDLILIIPNEKLREAKKKIFNYLSKFYEIEKEKINEIFKIDYIKLKQNSSFEFLGYKFEVENKSLKISVRYKTIRKFIYKFIYEYRPNRKQELVNFLVAKNYYLFCWLYSFKYINDHELLEKIYLRIILPNIYLTLKKFKIEEKFDNIKKFYRLKTILRIVRTMGKEKQYEKLEELKNKIGSVLCLANNTKGEF